MLRTAITPLIISFNESPNLGRCLDQLTWADRIVIVDSGSTDDTLEIAARYPQVEVWHRPFTDFASQCNFGLSLVQTEWVLSLDADYILEDGWIAEIAALTENDADAYRAAFVYCIQGHPLPRSLYPPRTVLYRAALAEYRNEGHGHRVEVAGRVRSLAARIRHDDRKPRTRWLASQQRYAQVEANHLMTRLPVSLGAVDRLRRTGWAMPILMFLYLLFCKRAFMQGWAGWTYLLERVAAEVIIALEIAQRRASASKQSLPKPVEPLPPVTARTDRSPPGVQPPGIGA